MKKIISCLLTLAMLTAMMSVFGVMASATDDIKKWDGTVGTGYDGGNGTQENPYLISSPEALAYLSSYVNQSVAGESACGQTYFKMTCDIDLNNQPWIPIGYEWTGSLLTSRFFSGIFDGNGYAIYNLNTSGYRGADDSVALTSTVSGFFGALCGGQVLNLGIESGISSGIGGCYIGSIAAYVSNGAKIENCYNKATVVRGTASAWATLGGIAGWVSNGDIKDCVNYGYVNGKTASTWNGNNSAAGIVGIINGGTLSGCYNLGNISGGTCRGGGLIARAYQYTGLTLTVSDCYSSGVILFETGADGTNAQCAYLIGIVEGGTFNNLYAYTKNQTATKNAIGNDASGLTTDKVTTNATDELVVPSAYGDGFLKATEAGKTRMTMVKEGTATVDGAIDEGYKNSSRVFEYGTGTNALSVGEWNDTVADLYAMADYNKFYFAADITDGDVVDHDSVTVTLSFDGGDTVFSVSVSKTNAVSVNGDAIAAIDVTSAVTSTADGYIVEFSVPSRTESYNLINESFVGVGVRLNDVDASDAMASFSNVPDGSVNLYKLGEIHGETGVEVTGVTLNKTEATLYISKTIQLEATIEPDNAFLQNKTWSSSDNSVASVDDTGLVTANSKGVATITVTTEDGDKTATCTITVIEKAVEGIVLDNDEIELKLGKKKTLVCTVLPEDAENKNVIWSSDNEKVATVSENGLVTAVGGGVATITVKSEDGGFEATCKVKVNVELDGITISEQVKELKVGESVTLSPKAVPDDATEPLPSLIWSSSDTSVATVDENGVVIAIGEGEAVITVSSADGKMTGEQGCTIKVSAEETDILEEEKKGCGSAILSGAFVIATVTGVAVAFAGKKRKD